MQGAKAFGPAAVGSFTDIVVRPERAQTAHYRMAAPKLSTFDYAHIQPSLCQEALRGFFRVPCL
jgi:hypothetical protein